MTRLAGSDRYATAAAVSKATFAAHPAAVYIASGLNFPDALAGAAAAAHVGAPVLLVNGGIPASTATELKRLVPDAHLRAGRHGVGLRRGPDGPRAVHRQPGPHRSVTRLGGADRYATAVAIAQATYSAGDTLYVANGENFPDALAGAPLGGPLLLVPNGDIVPQEVLDEVTRLAPPSMVVLGGPSGVSDAADAALHAAAGLPWP